MAGHDAAAAGSGVRDEVPAGRSPPAPIGERTRVEVAWRVLAGLPNGRPRAFGTCSRTVRGRNALRSLAADVATLAWNGELRIRVDGAEPLYTHVLEIVHWSARSPSPRARAASLWKADADRSAAKAAFLSRLRPVIDDAAGQWVVHRRDAQVLLALAAAACDGPISRRG